jgi:hypothetical protein
MAKKIVKQHSRVEPIREVDVNDASAVYAECKRLALASGAKPEDTEKWGTAIAKFEEDVYKANGGRPAPVKPQLPKAKAKRAEVEQPAQKGTEPVAKPSGPIFTELRTAGFKHCSSESNPAGVVAHGFAHKDGRAAVYTHNADGSNPAWMLSVGGKQSGGALKAGGVNTLRKALKLEALREGTIDEHDNAKYSTKTVAPTVPDYVKRALQKLGGFTKQGFTLSRLVGDDNYGRRLQLVKTLTNNLKPSVKEAQIGNLTTAFQKAVGATGETPAAREQHFIKLAKAITAVVRVQSARQKRADAAAHKQWRRDHQAEIAVPGKILDAKVPKVKDKQLAKEREALKAELASRPFKPLDSPTPTADKFSTKKSTVNEDRPLADAAGAGQPHPIDAMHDQLAHLVPSGEPHPGAPYFIPAQAALIEHRFTGVVMLQLRQPGLDGGAPCVYNNGKAVALGIVSLETLAKFRKIEDTDLPTAARQLLSPLVPSVTVTNVAQVHLTAVRDCKELIAMANAKSAKFAAPEAPKKATAAKADKKATPKASKKSVATGKQKGEHTPRSGGYAGKKIKVLNKNHGAKPDTKRGKALEILLTHKTTDEAIPKLAKVGADNSFIAFAVREGIIELS